MNGLGRKKEDNGNKNQFVFTRETLGVVLILFATLALVCLITRDSVFSVPGKYINSFLFGCFGYFAYAVVLYTAILGVNFIVGKKSKWSLKRKVLTTLCFISLALIVHIITLHGNAFSFGEYIAKSYTMAENGFAGASGGGFFTALLAYPIVSLLTEVGSYVVLGIIFLTLAYFTGKDLFFDAKAISNAGAEKFKSSYAPEKEEQPTTIPQVEIQGEREYPFAEVSSPQVQTASSKQKLFVNNPSDFHLKSKRDLSNPENSKPIKLGFTDGGLAVATAPEQAPTLKENADYKSKLDYIKTPPTIDLNAMMSNIRPNASVVNGYSVPKQASQTTVSNYINPVAKEEVKEEQDEIPFIEHSSGVTVAGESVSQRAETFGRYAEMEDIKSAQPIHVEEDVSFRAVHDQPVQPEVPQPVDEIPFIEETFEEEKIEQPIEPIQNTDPEQNESVRESRVRSILFGDSEETEEKIPEIKPEKTQRSERTSSLGFTSRVEKDGNSFSRRVEEVSLPEEIKEEVVEEKPKKELPPINREYFRPPLSLLESYAPPMDAPKENHNERLEVIKNKLEEFGISVEPVDYVQGPAVTRYEFKMPPGISVKKVLGYDDDLQMCLLSKHGIRVEAPIPGKNSFGIEVANKISVMVGLKEVLTEMATKTFKPDALIFALGKDIVGSAKYDDLSKGPHYLIAGSSGSGKSVCLNVMIVSLIMRYSPEELRFILIDPKRVEMRKFEHLPHLMIDEIITDPKKTLAVLQWAIDEMERRYKMFEEAGSYIDGIGAYNQYIASDTVPKMPKIVIVIDEFGDLMANVKKDLEVKIQILTQKARAAGIHIVLATQRPSVNVVTGVIKTNLPARIAFKVGNYSDSMIILDTKGAEKLLGNGDMLYKNSTMPDNERYQGAYISGREVNEIVKYINEHNVAYYDDELQTFLDRETAPKVEEAPVSVADGAEPSNEFDPLFLKALWLAVNTETVSIAQLQRRFQIGYPKAGGFIDKMERLGFVSQSEGSKARKVLMTREQFEERFGSMPD